MKAAIVRRDGGREMALLFASFHPLRGLLFGSYHFGLAFQGDGEIPEMVNYESRSTRLNHT